MNKEFSNIIIFNNKDILDIKKMLEKMFKDLGYNIVSSDDCNIQIDILNDTINNICIISSEYFKFKNMNTNKSVIRKISKRLAQDTFMTSSINDISVVEKYSFNKRTYDYICFGNREKLIELGYSDSYEKYMHKEIWKNHFVGRNNIESVDKILSNKNTFFENYEILIDILKLYGIKPELVTYKCGDEITNHEILKETVYIK